MIKNQMTLTLGIDQTDIKATTAAFLTQPDSAILPYTIGFVPWKWIEKSMKYRKMSSGIATANPNNIFTYNPTTMVYEQTKGIPFVYTARTGYDNGYMGVYEDNGTYARLPFAGNTNDNLAIIHSFNTQYYTTFTNAGMNVNSLSLVFFGYETISNADGWQGNVITSVKPITVTTVQATITPIPEIALTFTQNISSPYGGNPYTITGDTLNTMDDRGIMCIDGGTVDISGVTYNKTLYLFIRAIDVYTQGSVGERPGFGVCIMDKARLGSTSTTVYNQNVTDFTLTYGQTQTNQFIFGDVEGFSLEYPSPYGYYISTPENSECVFRYAFSDWINAFVSGGMTWYDILILLLTALPAYKINGSWYCAEFDDNFQLTGKFVEFANARDWQKNINGDTNTFDFNNIPEPGSSGINFKKFNGSTWEIVQHKIYGNGTDSLTAFPAMIQAAGEPLTDYLISGNTVQNGTPTPSDPVDVVGCGVRTENMLAMNSTSVTVNNITLTNDSGHITITGRSESEIFGSNAAWKNTFSFLLRAGTYYFSGASTGGVATTIRRYSDNVTIGSNNSTFTLTNDTMVFLGFYVYRNSNNDFTVMLNSGSTALPYEPYGYKLPITVNGTEYPIYLGQVETTRRIGKIDLSELSWGKIASGSGLWKTTDIPNIKYVSVNTELGNGIAEKYTIHIGSGMTTALNCIAIDVSQVSVNTGSNSEKPTGMFWYALTTPQTAVVNEPLMKIGDYADTISFAQAEVTIPTSDGDNIVSFETEVKPSAMSATFKGWHSIQGAKQYDGNDWS